jgi:threonyl-tRNA synthetase
MLKQWQEFQEQAKQRDHRLLGTKQEVFFFHNLSPGSCFWLPHGARVYNKLISFIREQYWKRGYEEVITPNIFNLQLWEISGHAQHYKENMFVFDVEEQEWGMKPMNCPGHCLLFGHRLRSYRELPFRVADFGVLHRNEVSGALTGLTRVRRFQQDDAHIFCRQDQIKSEVLGALDFMKFVYTVMGMTYKLELSTRPEKALGDKTLWDLAENQLEEALNEFAGVGNWRVNPGDGAFYGPKIDIKVFDAMERIHQCATVQLDFQLPIRFNLEYKTSGIDAEEAFTRPVMVHRAMLGSVERMAAVLTEHWGGKWPFWLSPRQVCIAPIDLKYVDYAYKVQQLIHDAGYYVDVDDSSRTFNKKVREAQVAQYNYILVVGQQEMEANTVNVRTRENEVQGVISIDDLLIKFAKLVTEYK